MPLHDNPKPNLKIMVVLLSDDNNNKIYFIFVENPVKIINILSIWAI